MIDIEKLVKRIIVMVIIVPVIIVLAQNFVHLVVRLKAENQLKVDIRKLETLIIEENVLSTDVINNKSAYSSFVNDILRESENSWLKYDVAVTNTGTQRITNNKDLYSRNYEGTNVEQNPIKVWYKDSKGDKVYIDSYVNCPQRYTVIYATLKLNIYLPCILDGMVTKNDRYCVENNRRLKTIEKEITVIPIKYYKGK